MRQAPQKRRVVDASLSTNESQSGQQLLDKVCVCRTSFVSHNTSFYQLPLITQFMTLLFNFHVSPVETKSLLCFVYFVHSIEQRLALLYAFIVHFIEENQNLDWLHRYIPL